MTAMTAIETFTQALRDWNSGNIVQAIRLTEDALAREPESLVYREAGVYLNRVLRDGKQGVYVSPEGFSAFIRGGGNVGLYANTSAMLRTAYEEYASLSLLDIGVGDGLALLPALTPNIHQLDLVEPSAAMLPNTRAQLDAVPMQHRAFNGTVQDFMAHNPFGNMEWDVIQATFSLQSVLPEDRPKLMGWLSERGGRVLMAEFDPPILKDPFADDWVKYVINHYERGLAEYARKPASDAADSPVDAASLDSAEAGNETRITADLAQAAELDPVRENLVAQGFLMPVMFGYFDTNVARTNWEVPVAEWVDLLKDAGFSKVETRLIYPYWWANAYLIDAS